VDENVFAYSNVHGDERGIVVYHNRFADTRGWIKISAAYLDKNKGDLRQKSLAEGLGLPFEGYVIFEDYVTHLEYIRSCEEFWQKGFYLDLHAYQHHVFMDWRFVDDERWRDIYVALNGAGVESMQAKFDEAFGTKDRVVRDKKKVTKRSRKENDMATKKPSGTKSRSTSKKGPVKKAVQKVGDVVGTVADTVRAIPGKLVPKKKSTTRKSSNSSSGKKTTAKKSSTRKSGSRKTSTSKSPS
jgi:hypothetical protein